MSVWQLNLISHWRRRARQETVYRQLGVLLRSGVALPTAFVQLKRFAPDEAFAKGLERVARRVASGATLGAALHDEPVLFERAHVALLAAGEASGTLDRVLSALAQHLEAGRRLRLRALVSSLWPGYLVGLALVLGPFVGVATRAGESSDLVGAYVSTVWPGLLGALGVATAIVLWPVMVAAARLEQPWDRVVLSVPLVGGALRRLAAARALLILGLSARAGLDVVRAIDGAVAAMGRRSLEAAGARAVQVVRSGGTLTSALEALGVFDRDVLGEVAIAEQTGTLDEALSRLAPLQHEATLRAVRVLIAVVAGLVAVVALGAVVKAVMGAISGPIKAYYDLAGTGRLPGESP